jgi:response regulator of citrate/malate metabolism
MKKSNYSYLIVEDEMEVCKQLQNRMNPFENWSCLGLIPFYDVAFQTIKTEKPDLLFLDYSIRGGNSFSLLNEIAAIENYSPYIIFFTAFQNDNPEIPENALNIYQVNKYLVKPIFEKLTLHLYEYVDEAEKWILKQQPKSFWIETILKEKIMLHPEMIICISQSENNSRNKIIRTIDEKIFEIKASWEVCEKIAKSYELDYFFANARYTLVNKKYITKIQKPYIWLNDRTKVEVTREKWSCVEVFKK